MGILAPKLTAYRPNEFDGFDFVAIANRVLEENLSAAEHGNRWPHGRIYIPKRFRKSPDEYPFHINHYYTPNTLAKCILWGVLYAARVPGEARKRKDMRRMEGGTVAHQRLQGEFRRYALGSELLVFDFENRINGYIDHMLRNYETGELAVVDYKHRGEFAFRKILRKGLAAHLRATKFYPPLPDDTVQVMLYIWMFRRLVHDITHSPENTDSIAALLRELYGITRRRALQDAEKIFDRITFGWRVRKGYVLCENQSDHDQRKGALVEYDQAVVDRILSVLKLAERYVDDGTLVDYSGDQPRMKPVEIPEDLACHLAPEDAYIHSICPYRKQCAIGMLAEQHRGPRRDYPVHVLLKIKRAKQAAPKLMPEPEPAQTSIFATTVPPGPR